MSQPAYRAWWEDEKPGRSLPGHLEKLLERNDSAFLPELFRFAFQEVRPYYEAKFLCLEWEVQQDFSWIWTLYLHPHPFARQGFLALLADYSAQELDTKLGGDFFVKELSHSSFHNCYSPYYLFGRRRFTLLSQRGLYYPYLKAIYKRAEKMQDRETWARLAFRFDTENRSEFTYGRYQHSTKTVRYLQRRAWRFLRRMGEKRSAEYVKWASEVLLHYRFDNAFKYAYRDVNKEEVDQTYLHLWLYNHILFHNSKRFVYQDKSWLQASVETFCEEREEAFPELWDQPEARDFLWLLVREAQTSPVVEFAGRVLLQSHTEFMDQLSPQQISALFRSSLPARRALGARLKLERQLPEIDPEKWFAYLKANDPVIQREAVYLIRRHHQRIPVEIQQQLVSTLLRSFEQGDLSLFNSEVAVLLQHEWCSILLSVMEAETWRRLVQIKNFTLKLFALEILKGADVTSLEINGHDLLPFLEGDYYELQQTAQQVVEQQFENLQLDADFLFALLTSSAMDTRQFALRLCQKKQERLKPYTQALMQKCWARVINEETEDELRDYIRESLMQQLFSHELEHLSLERILHLLESDQQTIQDWGVELLHTQPIEAFAPTWLQLTALAHCRLAQIREEARTWLKERRDEWTVPRMANLLETDWDDTRHWMMAEIQSLESISSELLYALLDTARTDVQTLAMELVRKHEADLDLRELALRASESPYLHVQTYALTLLERIEWDVELWERLSLFFRTVLLQVNKGRKAKELAWQQLAHLSEDDQLALRIVPLLNDVARNSGKRDFARVLTLLTQIKKRYPHFVPGISIIG